MTIEDKYDFVKKFWNEHMFISSSTKIESTLDENIPFSKYDEKILHIYKYKNKPDEISVTYQRVSNVFQWANDILNQWGFEHLKNEDKLFYNPGLSDREYRWYHPKLNYITVKNNIFHKDRFQVNARFSGNYFTVKTKKDIEIKILNTITWLIKDKKDTQLLRKLHLKELLYESNI